MTTVDLRKHAHILTNLYGVDGNDLYLELITFRSSHPNTFKNFPELAKFILTKLSESDFPLLRFFSRIILVLPFATADCERSFSAMNRIKSPERNRLKDILTELMLLYTITSQEKSSLDLLKLAKKVVHQLWKYDKKNLLSPGLRRQVEEGYKMMFV